jgi:hypothetical protein
VKSRFLMSAAALVLGGALVARRQLASRAGRLLLASGVPRAARGELGAGVPDGPEPVETGEFAVAGQALATGHVAVSAVSFARRRPEATATDAVRLVVESAHNVPDGGLVVLGHDGFAPDVEGFTLMLASAGPGPFAASGRYEVHTPAALPRVTHQGDPAR